MNRLFLRIAIEFENLKMGWQFPILRMWNADYHDDTINYDQRNPGV
jgi:hypothetical protein